MISDIVDNDIEKFTLPNHARVWIFQSDRSLTVEETELLQLNGKKFAAQWRAHGKELTAQFEVVHHLFLVMAIDQEMEGASGCSIDTFMRFILEAEKQMGLNLTNRLCFASVIDDELRVLNQTEAKSLASEGKFTKQTPVFDNLVANLGQLRHEWLKPASALWVNRLFT